MEEKMIKKIKNNDGWRRIAVRPITGNKADIRPWMQSGKKPRRAGW
jgi:hypothetical protein